MFWRWSAECVHPPIYKGRGGRPHTHTHTHRKSPPCLLRSNNAWESSLGAYCYPRCGPRGFGGLGQSPPRLHALFRLHKLPPHPLGHPIKAPFFLLRLVTFSLRGGGAGRGREWKAPYEGRLPSLCGLLGGGQGQQGGEDPGREDGLYLDMRVQGEAARLGVGGKEAALQCLWLTSCRTKTTAKSSVLEKKGWQGGWHDWQLAPDQAVLKLPGVFNGEKKRLPIVSP